MNWDEQYKAGQGRYFPNEELVRFLGRTYGPVVNVPCRGLKAVELGCGVGGNVIALTSWGFFVIGLDSSLEALNRAQDYMLSWTKDFDERTLFSYYQAPAKLAWGDNSQDLVIDIQTIQHLSDADHEAMYQEVARVLKSGGRFFTVHWTGEEMERRNIFPDHPELEPWLIFELKRAVIKSGLSVGTIETYRRSYKDRSFEGTWAVLEAVKP